MNRDFYFFGILFLGLYVIAALFNCIIFFQIDFHLHNLHSFGNWLLVILGTALIGSIFSLKYFSHKGYKFAFVTGLMVVISGLFQNIFFYFLLQSLLKGLQDYYIPVYILSLGAGLLFGISLVFSKAGKNPWLRGMGIFILIIVVFSAYVLNLSLNVQPGQPISTIIQLTQWIVLAASLEFIPLIMVFYTEFKTSKSDSETSVPYKYSEFLTCLGGVTVLMILVIGIMVGTQSFWSTHASPGTKALAEPFEARSYVNREGDSLLYRLLLPLDYDPEKQYPMVVCLHGGAGYGTDNFRQFDGSLFARMLSKPENREKYPAFVFVPQCRPGSSWGGLPNLPAVDELVFETIGSLTDEFAVDENRLFVAGHSLGGYGTWHFIGTRPDKFAAAIPFAGEGNPDLAPNMLNVAIWAFHGANDGNVPVSGSRDVIEAIRNAGGDPRYTESPKGGHGWEIIEDTPGVLEWLFAQKRD
ncbi:prolyl oligopeptidase family serine peptidase [Aquiflexum sp.]|uniref:prolyl oligopeptidase family serine peptidase n=1 Tax=Aquiflexum sp. TaxID=1872584 RepID=UPI003593E3C1